jgi:hypothetical protein
MKNLRKNAIQRVTHVGAIKRRVSERSKPMSPFGGAFNALRPLIS